VTTPEPSPPAVPTDAGDEQSCRVRRPRLIPSERARTVMPAMVVIGKRPYEGACPPESEWRRLVPFIDFAGEFVIGEPGTPRADAAEQAIAAFLSACFAGDVRDELVARFMNDVEGVEGIEAAQNLVRAWWPEVEVRFDGELLS